MSLLTRSANDYYSDTPDYLYGHRVHRLLRNYKYCNKTTIEDPAAKCRQVLPRDFVHDETWPIVWALPAFGIVCTVWLFSFLVVYCSTPKRLLPRPGDDRVRYRVVESLFYTIMFILAPPLLVLVLAWFLVFAVLVAPLRWAFCKIRKRPPGPRGYMHPGMIVNRVLFPSAQSFSTEEDLYTGKEEFLEDGEEDDTLSPRSRHRHSSLPSIVEEEFEHDTGDPEPSSHQHKSPRETSGGEDKVERQDSGEMREWTR